ncbi:MAG: endo-1,4-beta-xylanase, partial [Ruminococcus sp.]
VVIWGVTDDQSWRASRVPLLFDENFQAKPAFYSVIDDVEPKVTTTTTTGTTTTTTETTTTTTTDPDIILGDIDLDGSVRLNDLVHLQKYLIRKETLNAEQGKAADMNQDDQINVVDIILWERLAIFTQNWDA